MVRNISWPASFVFFFRKRSSSLGNLHGLRIVILEILKVFLDEILLHRGLPRVYVTHGGRLESIKQIKRHYLLPSLAL